jgi:hypothetical protein
VGRNRASEIDFWWHDTGVLAFIAEAVAFADQAAFHLQDWNTPLHAAARMGEDREMAVLLEAGADREAKDEVSG